MPSTITITFATDVSAGDFVELKFMKILIGAGGLPRRETWQTTPRYTTGTIQVEAPTGNPGEKSAQQYIQYFNNDYGLKLTDGTYRIWAFPSIVDVNMVDIIAFDYNGECVYGFTDILTNNVNVTAVVNNCGASTLTLVSSTPSEATVPCSNFRMSIQTSIVCPNIFLNGIEIETSNVANPYIIDLPRDINNRLTFIDASLQTLTVPANGLSPYFVPSFSEQNINVEIETSLISGGATLTVNVILWIANPTQTFTYSLNGIDYQSSNIFTGQSSGVGTMYVKDNFGCVKTKQYEITDFGTREPYLFISKANSLSFIEIETIDNYNIFPNEKNTFAFNGLEPIKYCDEVLFQTNDVTTIQFKSNYDTPNVYLRHGDGTADTLISLSKKTANLNRFQNMDCWYYKYGEGLLGIYFTSGNTYDELDVVNGTFILNGNLPDMAIVGTTIQINGVGIFQIVDWVYDETINKKAMLVEHTYNGLPTQSTVKAYFDLLPFEVYEFTIDWSVYGIGTYDVLIDNTDATNGTVQHLSENIIIKDLHKDTLAIRYYNNNNRDIFYKFGIEHFIRVPYIDVEGTMLQEDEVNITDLTTSLSKSSVNEGDVYYFEEVVKSQMRKLVIALSCENVFINGLGYTKNGEIELEKVKGTNLYDISATMISTNINYNNNRQGQEGIEEGGIVFDIPAFITDGSNHLKA